MASPSSRTPSPPSSPPPSLLTETIDYRDITAQSLEEEPTHPLPRQSSPASSESSDRTITLRDLSLSRQVSPAASSSDHTITPGDLAGPEGPPSLSLPAITDRIDIPSAALPTPDSYEQRYPYGILNFAHLHLRIGREVGRAPNTMEPAPPARVVQRNDFNWPIPNGDPNDKVLATKGRTTNITPTTTTAASKVGGEAKSLGLEVEAAVLAKSEYNDKFGAFRKRWTTVEDELADKAKEMRATRFVSARELRPIVGAIGVMYALGKAVDLAAFPGKAFGEFDEKACSPEGYLSSLFPELTSRTSGVSGPILPLQWDFSLSGIMAGEKQDWLPALWAAVMAGNWEAVDEMTSGVLAEAEELLGGV